MNFDIDSLIKQARILSEDDQPNANPELQKMVGDPDDSRISTFAQFKPNPGSNQIPNPMSPIEGDEIFYSGIMAGAVFQAHDGSEWTILNYGGPDDIEIENRWYPRYLAPHVSIFDLRRSIHQFLEPFQQVVPPPPVGVDYSAQLVRIVDKDSTGRADEFSNNDGWGSNSGGW